MIELFVMGGPLFMGIITIGLILVLASSVRGFILIFGAESHSREFVNDQLRLIKSAGLFSAVCGVLGQMIGLFSAFKAIEQMGSVSPEMLAGGLKISSITTLYGLSIYVLALIIWLLLSALMKKN